MCITTKSTLFSILLLCLVMDKYLQTVTFMLHFYQGRLRMLPVITYLENEAKFDKGKTKMKSVIEVHEVSFKFYTAWCFNVVSNDIQYHFE